MRLSLRDGVRIHAEVRGDDGPAALLVHGFTGSIEAWGESVLDGLADSRRVVAVDLVGHGRSDVPPDPSRYAIDEVVRDLAEVLDRLEVSRSDWIGYSMGGRVALAAAVLRPERVRRLVLEGASPGIRNAEEAAERRARDEALADRILAEGVEPFVDRWMDQPLFESQKRLPVDRIREARERRLECDPLGLANTLRGLGTGQQPSFWNELSSLRAPTLLITGRDDRKFTDIARKMEERIPRSVHVIVPDAGHTVHLERRDEWLREVTAFLARSRRLD